MKRLRKSYTKIKTLDEKLFDELICVNFTIAVRHMDIPSRNNCLLSCIVAIYIKCAHQN